MKILDPITWDALLPDERCTRCFGKGFILIIRSDLDARKFREVRPCTCVKEIVRVEDDDAYAR